MKFVASGLAILLAAWMPSVVPGQDVSRFQHARQHVRPTAYEVICFLAGPPTPNDLSLQQQFDELAQSHANVTCTLVDVQRDPELMRCSPAARQAWLSKSEPIRPRYMVLAPSGAELYADNDPPPAVSSLFVSPARERLVAKLTADCAGVFVFVPGHDEAVNAECKKVLAAYVREINDATETNGDVSSPHAAWLAVDSHNLAEDWLVRSLRLLTDGAAAATALEPLVCLVYGRARVNSAATASEISRDRLLADWQAILTVHDSGRPEDFVGLDLPVQHDWDRDFSAESAPSSRAPRRDKSVQPASAEQEIARESASSTTIRPAPEPLPFSLSTLSISFAVGLIALLWLMFVIIRPS